MHDLVVYACPLTLVLLLLLLLLPKGGCTTATAEKGHFRPFVDGEKRLKYTLVCVYLLQAFLRSNSDKNFEKLGDWLGPTEKVAN